MVPLSNSSFFFFVHVMFIILGVVMCFIWQRSAMVSYCSVMTLFNTGNVMIMTNSIVNFFSTWLTIRCFYSYFDIWTQSYELLLLYYQKWWLYIYFTVDRKFNMNTETKKKSPWKLQISPSVSIVSWQFIYNRSGSFLSISSFSRPWRHESQKPSSL